MVKAILLDPEARVFPADPASGKLSEPIVRLTRVLRALPKAPGSNPPVLGRYLVSNVLDSFNQAPVQAPTVFNFYLPNYQPPGPLLAAGLTAPEFQITTELSTVDTSNYFFDGVTSGFPVSSGPRLGVDQSSLEALWTKPDSLYARIETLLLGRPMSAGLRVALERVRGSYSTAAEGVRAMLQLVASTPEFTVDR
jgi:hypothetical protein